MALSCIISKIKRDIGQISQFFHTPAFDTPVRGRRRSITILSGTEQEAQLSQRDRATLRVTEYFAKSLKVTQDHSK